MDKVHRASFSLEPDYIELLRAVADQTRRPMTEELRIMIDARAAALGLDPVRPIDPKPFGPTRELSPN